MAYEKLLNELYAAISLEYLWPEYRPCFVKSESPDWINENMDLGLEVSQALLPEDGQAESFLEKFLGCLRKELPQAMLERYGERLHFYNDRFWAILPEKGQNQDTLSRAKYRFDRKLEKLNRNYRCCASNALYLFLHPEAGEEIDCGELFRYIKEKQADQPVRFDWVFLNCGKEIRVCNFRKDTLETIPLPENAELFLASEAERLRHDCSWSVGMQLGREKIRVIRATELWQQTGAYYVRIHGMNRQYRIPLEKEFDRHDTPETKYLVLLDDGYPFGTCRMFAAGDGMAEIGRVVVLEQYRGKGYGSLLLREAERWLKELGFSRACVESRDVAVGFYEKLGYRVLGKPAAGDTFLCVHMEKELCGR